MCPIDCQQALKQIELFLDDELDLSLHAEVRQHLAGCGPCMDHSEFRRHLKELLRAKCGCDDVPAHLMERVSRLLHETPPA